MASNRVQGYFVFGNARLDLDTVGRRGRRSRYRPPRGRSPCNLGIRTKVVGVDSSRQTAADVPIRRPASRDETTGR
ncbi:hypothetical protein L686_07930 [Stutzerimonas stutzeri MF28]|nr:hypothetical protein L686_07930 [Stutzerimonas stutzeri MF28]